MQAATDLFSHTSGRGPTARLLAVLLFAVSVATAAPAFAQDDIITPDKTQFELYTRGADAYRDGDYKKAISLFEGSLAIGELNITYLNLGRALFKIGQCDKAQAAYAKARTSPKIANPTPMQVLQKINEYNAELPTACPAYLTVSCNPGDLSVFVDGQGPLACDGSAITLLPGEHTIRAERDGEKVEQKITVKGMDKPSIKLEIPALLAGGGGGGGNLDPDPNPDPEPGVTANPTVPYNGPNTILGANLSVIITGTSDIELDGGDIILPTHDDISAFGFDGYAAFRILQKLQLYLGARVGFIPGFELEDPQIGSTLIGSETDINGLLIVMIPIGSITPFVSADGGFSLFSDDEGESLTGFNGAVGGGVRWNISRSLALSADIRFQGYSGSRSGTGGSFSDFEGIGGEFGQQRPPGFDEFDVDISGSRTTFNLGASLDF